MSLHVVPPVCAVCRQGQNAGNASEDGARNMTYNGFQAFVDSAIWSELLRRLRWLLDTLPHLYEKAATGK